MLLFFWGGGNLPRVDTKLDEVPEAKEADARARLAAEVEQLKSQLDKEKKMRLSQSVAEPTPKRAKQSAAASRKKLAKIDGLFVHRFLTVSLCTDYTNNIDCLFVHRLD